MQKSSDFIFLDRGFRPFFFMAAIYSVVCIGLWSSFYAGLYTPAHLWLAPASWHAHEMIYGFTLAVIAGFLLTAVANWTGKAPVRYWHLAGLCALWLAGRIVMNVEIGLPVWACIVIEGLFIPALAISLALPLLRSKNIRNFIFLGLLSMLFAFDVLFLCHEDKAYLYGALTIILMMISLVGGRIIPAFTVAALRQRGEKLFQADQKKLDAAAVASLVPVGLCLAVWPSSWETALFAFVSAILHLMRLRKYYFFKSFVDPMLWILHLGYLWIIIGLSLLVLVGFGIVTRGMVVHAFTVGVIGSMCIGMMSRVTLGHSGRVIKAGRITILAFVLMQIAVVLRLLGPIILPAFYTDWIVSAGLSWGTVFALFLIAYAPIFFSSNPPQISKKPLKV